MPDPTQESHDTVVVRRMTPAPREAVFAAWIDPESIKHWMCPGDITKAEAQLDPRVGGSFRIVMKGKNQDYEHTGEYQVVQPPSKLVFTWISKGTDHQPTLVTVELLERGQQSELVLTHQRLPRAEAVNQHKGGWSQITDRLAEYFEKGAERRTSYDGGRTVIRKIAQYEVRRNKLERVNQAIIEFVDAVAQNEPHTLYEAYQKDDEVSFIHFMAFPDQDAQKRHQTAPYTIKFVEALHPNCEESSTFIDLRVVRSSQES